MSFRVYICILFLSFFIFSEKSFAENPNYILEIEAPEYLKENLKNKTLLGHWVGDPDFDKNQLSVFISQGKLETKAILEEAGFFSPSIKILEQKTVDSIPKIRILVDSGTRSKVEEVFLKINWPKEIEKTQLAQEIKKSIYSQWTLPAGTFFTSAAWEKGKKLVTNLLMQKGFIRARIIESHADVTVAQAKVSLTVKVESGPPFHFGPLRIKGLSRYNEFLVRNLVPWTESFSEKNSDFLSDIKKKSSIYNYDVILRFQNRLRASGYFSSVDVAPDIQSVELDQNLKHVPIKVDVVEQPTQRVALQAGYNTDTGVRGLLGHTYRNLLNRGLYLESGILLHSINTQISSPMFVEGRLFANIRSPISMDSTYFQSGGIIENTTINNNTFERATIFLGKGTGSEQYQNFFSLQYQFEKTKFQNEFMEDSTKNTSDNLWRKALLLSFSELRQDLDSLVTPTKGYSLNLQIAAALKELGSTATFSRLYGNLLLFTPFLNPPLLSGGVLINKFELGVVSTIDSQEIPSSNLFLAGGSQSLRGYDYQSLGVTHKNINGVSGARIIGITSIEYQHPIKPEFLAAVFADVGGVTDSISNYKPVLGVGVGLRWRSLVGPVNLDMAYGLPHGGKHIYFSVGYSF